MLFPPNLLTIGTEGKAVSGAANGVVYISTHSDSTYKNLRAMVIKNIETLSSPNMKFDEYTRASTANNFALTSNPNYRDIIILMPSGMQGSRELGYFITNNDYTSTTNATVNYPDPRTHGVTPSFSKQGCNPWLYFTDPNMVGFDPYNWKLSQNIKTIFTFS
jgi:hypothetical protein